MNVLIALADEKHSHHQRALDWLNSNTEQGWATCPITLNGCVRILAQPRYSNPLSVMEAVRRLRELVSDSQHRFIPDDVNLFDEGLVDVSSISGHRQLTDIYLLALAVAHGLQFVTLDRGVRMESVKGANEKHLVVI